MVLGLGPGGEAVAERFADAGMAGAATVTPDSSPAARRVRDLTDGWDDTVAVDRLEGKRATALRCRGRLISAEAALDDLES